MKKRKKGREGYSVHSLSERDLSAKITHELPTVTYLVNILLGENES